MGKAWSWLTTRGRGFLVTGLVVVGITWVLGERDLVWIGLLLIALPISALIVVGRSRLRLGCDRAADPPQIALGHETLGRIGLVKQGGLPTGLLQFEDSVPGQLGRPVRFLVHRGAGAWKRAISYRMRGTSRGLFETGPLLVRASDPFGMVRVDRQFTARTPVLVTPVVEPLGSMSTAHGAGISGSATSQRSGLLGADDVLVREYRTGDDVRRIHWRSTARTRRMMVRREEQAWDPAVVILLDSRERAHVGTGPASSFEWAVSAAASIAVHFLSAGFAVELLDASGPIGFADGRPRRLENAQDALTRLTHVKLEGRRTLARPVEELLHAAQGPLLIAVLGHFDGADAAELVMAGRQQGRCLAVSLDGNTFAAAQDPRESDGDAGPAAAVVLREARWRVVKASRGQSIASVWAELERLGEGRS